MRSFLNIIVILLIFLGLSGTLFQYGVNVGMTTIASMTTFTMDKCITTMDFLIKERKKK